MASEAQEISNTSTQKGPNLLFWALFAICAGLLGYIFYDGLELMVKWWDRDEYSHGYMIPLVALFLVWQKLDRIPAVINGGNWSGVVLLALGLVVFIMGEYGSLYTVIQYAFLLSLYALIIATFGWRTMLLLWAALIYLTFMIPLPSFLYNNLSSSLQLISSEIGVFVVRLFDISVHLEGNVIDLGTYQLQVVEACSGLRYLFPLMSFGFLIAYVYRGPFWHRAVLFLSTIPITVLMNSIRIGIIGVTVEYWGIEMAEGFLHDFEGWVIFMGCLGVLAVEMWLFHHFSGGTGGFMDRLNLDGPQGQFSLADFSRPISEQKPLIASVILLIAAAVGFQALGARTETELSRKSFSEFPLYKDGWVGREAGIEEKVLDALQLTDYIQANYNRLGFSVPVNFYVAYYASQSKGASIHSPKSCLPGGGWLLTGMEEKQIPGLQNASGKPLVVNRALMRKGEAAQIVYYWFEQRGRNITSEYAAKWYMFTDAVTMNRTDGALLRVVVPVADIADIDESEKVAQDFLHTFYPLMPDYIPGKAQ